MRKYRKGGLIDEEKEPIRLNVSGGGGRGRQAGSMAGGRVGVSIPVGKDMEIEPYVQGGVTSRFGGKVEEAGISFVKRFSRGGVVRGWKK